MEGYTTVLFGSDGEEFTISASAVCEKNIRCDERERGGICIQMNHHAAEEIKKRRLFFGICFKLCVA